MQRKIAYTFALTYLILGIAIFSLSSIFRNHLSDFALGFFEGMSIVLILSSIVYLIGYYIKKKSS